MDKMLHTERATDKWNKRDSKEKWNEKRKQMSVKGDKRYMEVNVDFERKKNRKIPRHFQANEE